MRANEHSFRGRTHGEVRCAFFSTISAALLLLLILPGDARPSWLLDPVAFHASVHGRMSCGDCHEDILKKQLHPDPEDIRKGGEEFFTPERCLSCHDDVKGNLAKNLHGSKPIDDPEMYRGCLECHDPHAQRPVREEVAFDPSLPRQRQCGACHEKREILPALSPEDQACMECHRAPLTDDPRESERIQGICLHCHAEGYGVSSELTSGRVPLLRTEEYRKTPHAEMNCTVCHPDSTGFDHSNQESGSCWRCHEPHSEKVTHDAHIGVSCESCHLKGVRAVKEPEGIFWMREEQSEGVSQIHEMSLKKGGEASCRRCHSPGNEMGASAVVLPAKGLLCMPCHTATFSVGDTTTALGLVVFIAGVGLFLAPAFGRGRGETGGLPSAREHSRGILPFVRALFLDVLLQRRLFSRSKTRWVVHGLIFYPFLFRFLWGLIALIGSTGGGVQDWIWEMIDKNQPVTAFFFDISGVMILIGVVLAIARGARGDRLPGEPRKDWIGLGLIAAIVVIGFMLEGWRIAMTGAPDGSQYAFIGHWISGLFNVEPQVISGFYDKVWYTHAILTGVFVAYIPFSRLFHVILAPLVLLMNGKPEVRDQRSEVRKGK